MFVRKTTSNCVVYVQANTCTLRYHCNVAEDMYECISLQIFQIIVSIWHLIFIFGSSECMRSFRSVDTVTRWRIIVISLDFVKISLRCTNEIKIFCKWLLLLTFVIKATCSYCWWLITKRPYCNTAWRLYIVQHIFYRMELLYCHISIILNGLLYFGICIKQLTPHTLSDHDKTSPFNFNFPTI